MSPKNRIRISLAVRAMAAACAALLPMGLACNDVDWNWDIDWWRRPRRVVRPRPSAENAPRPGDDQRSESGTRDSETTPDEPATVATGNDAPVETQVAQAELSTVQRATPNRPFHALYLISGSGENQPEDRAGTRHVALARAPPGAVARMIEWLYVPMGRSGSRAAPYLIYENVAEFDAACRVSTDLDVSPLAMSAPAAGSGDAARVGTGMLLHLLQQGPALDKAFVEACETKLAEVVQSSAFDPPSRWRAAILAARLAADYRYDYDAARSYCRQAERHSEPNSIEQMTARWWRADALIQAGQRHEGLKIYRGIVNRYGERWPTAAIVERARSILTAK